MSNKYCGIDKVPKGKKRGNMVDCVNQNQIRYFGLKKIDPKLVFIKNQKSKLDVEKRKLRSKIIKLRARKNKFVKILKSMGTVSSEAKLKKKEEARDKAKEAQAQLFEAIDAMKQLNKVYKSVPSKTKIEKATPSRIENIARKMQMAIMDAQNILKKSKASQTRLTKEYLDLDMDDFNVLPLQTIKMIKSSARQKSPETIRMIKSSLRKEPPQTIRMIKSSLRKESAKQKSPETIRMIKSYYDKSHPFERLRSYKRKKKLPQTIRMLKDSITQTPAETIRMLKDSITQTPAETIRMLKDSISKSEFLSQNELKEVENIDKKLLNILNQQINYISKQSDKAELIASQSSGQRRQTNIKKIKKNNIKLQKLNKLIKKSASNFNNYYNGKTKLRFYLTSSNKIISDIAKLRIPKTKSYDTLKKKIKTKLKKAISLQPQKIRMLKDSITQTPPETIRMLKDSISKSEFLSQNKLKQVESIDKKLMTILNQQINHISKQSDKAELIASQSSGQRRQTNIKKIKKNNIKLQKLTKLIKKTSTNINNYYNGKTKFEFYLTSSNKILSDIAKLRIPKTKTYDNLKENLKKLISYLPERIKMLKSSITKSPPQTIRMIKSSITKSPPQTIRMIKSSITKSPPQTIRMIKDSIQSPPETIRMIKDSIQSPPETIRMIKDSARAIDYIPIDLGLKMEHIDFYRLHTATPRDFKQTVADNGLTRFFGRYISYFRDKHRDTILNELRFFSKREIAERYNISVYTLNKVIQDNVKFVKVGKTKLEKIFDKIDTYRELAWDSFQFKEYLIIHDLTKYLKRYLKYIAKKDEKKIKELLKTYTLKEIADMYKISWVSMANMVKNYW